MRHRLIPIACTAAIALVVLLPAAGSGAQAAPSRHMFAPMVGRDAPPTATPSPTLVPTAVPTPVPAAVHTVGISSGPSSLICLSAPAIGVAVSLVNGQAQLVPGAPIAVYYRYPAITGYYQTTGQIVVTDASGTAVAAFPVCGFIDGAPGDVLQLWAAYTSGGQTYYSQLATRTFVFC